MTSKKKKKILMKEIFQKNEHSHCMCLYKQEARNQNLFCQLSKNIIFGFLGTLSETSSRTFFFKNSDFAWEERRKKLCEIRYDEEKKSNTQLCDKYVFVSLIRFFWESLSNGFVRNIVRIHHYSSIRKKWSVSDKEKKIPRKKYLILEENTHIQL